MLLKKIKTMREKKRAQGLITGIVSGVIGLVVLVIVGFVIVQTLNDASLLTAGTAEKSAADNLTANLSDGIDRVAEKIPTVLKIAAVVLLLGALVFLVAQARRMGFFTGTGQGSL
jgi:ascorbate-specific PTS system EIIC-type component UlaA|tara:strand:- start:68 stop:412 length:345 start_codon:yes stop_codon:yes gene_type:complete